MIDIEDARALLIKALVKAIDCFRNYLRTELFTERLPGGKQVVVGDEVAEAVTE